MKTLRIIGIACVATFLSLSACSGGDEPVVPTPPQPEVIKSEIRIDENIIANGLTFTHKKSELSVSFSTNESWALSISVTSGAGGWCTASATNGSKGSASVTFSVSENTAYDDRTASVTIKSGSATKTFAITQKFANALLADAGKYEIGTGGGVVEVKVKYNVEFDVQIPQDVTWVTQTDSRALTEKTIYLKVAENTTTDDRQAEITLAGKDSVTSQRIVISQEGIVNGSFADGVVTFEKPGTMKRVLGDDYLNITSLKVVGPMNSDDARCLRQMSGGIEFEGRSGRLASLDLSDATIVAGGEAYYDVHTTSPDAIGNSMFHFCNHLQDIVLPTGLTSIGEAAFYQCPSLVSVHIPASVTYIGRAAFLDCHALASVHIADLSAWCQVTHEDSSSSPFFCGGKFYLNGEELKELVIPEDITEIKPYAFAHSQSLTSVDVPDHVTSIGDGAFDACYALKSVHIGQGVNSIGACAFYFCSSLSSVSLSTGVASIGISAFFDCNSLESVHIPDLSTWLKIAFADERSNPLYNESKLYVNHQLLTDLVIPEDITEIKPYAFGKYIHLLTVDIPHHVTSIGAYAFFGTCALTSASIGDGVVTIGERAFWDCGTMSSLTLGAGVTTLGTGAFQSCHSLRNVALGNQLTTIGENAFAYSGIGPDLDIPDSVTTIGRCAFYQCHSLGNVTIGNGVTTIGDLAFASISLYSITLGTGITSIGEDAFYGSPSMRYVYITDLSAWCNIAFANIYANPLYSEFVSLCLDGEELTEVVIPADVKNIRNYAFHGYRALTKVTLGEGVASVGTHSFENCTSLTQVYCEGTRPPALNTTSFDDSKDEKTLFVPKGKITAYKTFGWDSFFGTIKEVE